MDHQERNTFVDWMLEKKQIDYGNLYLNGFVIAISRKTIAFTKMYC